jgi:autotransporter-associated beta strand protein
MIADGSNSISFVKNGDGAQVLGAANTYTGTTTVNAGTLLIHGVQTAATGAVQVNSGTLGGTGTLGGNVTVSATGTIAPGFTTGTLTVPSADLSSGATLAIDVNDANAAKSDLLAVTGSLNVENAKLVFNVTGAPAESSYLIASASSITGSITPANITGLPAGYELVQSATEIRLNQSTGSDYDDWFALYPGITNPDDKLPTADPDGDGLTNQQEYAFGLAPNNAASSNPILTQLNKTAAAFRYSRRSSSNLTYTIWTSFDLITWNPDATASQTPETANANNVQAVNVILTGAPLTADKLFVRVKAE